MKRERRKRDSVDYEPRRGIFEVIRTPGTLLNAVLQWSGAVRVHVPLKRHPRPGPSSPYLSDQAVTIHVTSGPITPYFSATPPLQHAMQQSHHTPL
ncbi:hypothetical protein E2C01_068339 [Portunus trituberculatus]|uniref:Uncharacterized protein n=1 Tax=Portunus trituberculatus TaxID=210409 RepID=A0A5B7HVY4_PORTR|nr:hypothetical protein [Portunus trituberculatus]